MSSLPPHCRWAQALLSLISIGRALSYVSISAEITITLHLIDMPHNSSNTIIYDDSDYGVSDSDICAVLLSGSNGETVVQDCTTADGRMDCGLECKSENINKWARYKPIVVPTIHRLTYSDISDAMFGLSPITNTLLYSKSDAEVATGTSVVADADELASIFAANAQWTYTKPYGGTEAPYRRSDFAQPADNDSGWGYYHCTPPPVERVRSMGIDLSAIRTCRDDTSITSTAGSTIGGWVVNDPSNSSPLYSNLAFRYGEASQYQVNDASTYAISLPFMLGMESGECWRLAVAVQVPDSNGDLSYMRLFTSRMTFIDAQSVSTSDAPKYLMPSLGTNQYLCKLIDEYANYLVNTISSSTTDELGNTKVTVSNPTFKLPACLCVVKDMYMGHVSRDSSSTYTHCYLNAASSVYSAPALLTEFEIVINDDDFSGGDVDAYTHLSLTLVGTGNIAIMGSDSSKRIPINEIRLMQLKPVTSDMVIYYRYSCTWVAGFDGDERIMDSDTITSSVTLKAGAVEGDSNWIDRSIKGNPGLYLISKEQSTSPIT